MEFKPFKYQPASFAALMFFVITSFSGCGFFEVEKNIETDKAERDEVLRGLAATYWKGAKISVRSLPISAATESINFEAIKKQQQSELQLGNHLSHIYDWEFLLKDEESEAKSLSVSELIELAGEIYQMSGTIESKDEDDYPTMMEVISNSRVALKKEPLELPENWNKSMEHWLFAVVMEARFGFGSWKTYELGRVDAGGFTTTDLKVFSGIHKSIDQLRNEWFYLTEETLTETLEILDGDKITLLAGSKSAIKVANGDKHTVEQQFQYQMKALTHLLRGFSRKQMERVELEEKALEDVQAAIKNFSKAGIDNELLWLSESYLYIKTEENEKAVLALTKLEGSRFISKKEKALIHETKEKIKSRDPESALNLITDKIIMYKLGLSYATSYFAEIQWLKLLEKTEEGRELLNKFKELEQKYQKAKKYIDIDELSKKGKELLKMG